MTLELGKLFSWPLQGFDLRIFRKGTLVKNSGKNKREIRKENLQTYTKMPQDISDKGQVSDPSIPVLSR